MIDIIANGETVSVSDNKLTTLLAQIGLLGKEGIAVAVNESVVPRSEWPPYILHPNDSVIIITATQGA